MNKSSIFFIRIAVYPVFFFFCQSIGGNITTASPISDLNPLFLAAGALLEVQSRGLLL